MPRSRSRPTPPARPARLAAELFGRRSETLAAWYLRLKGYRIVARRYKCPVGEIDLVAERFGTTVFIEVKARSRHATEAETWGAVNRRRLVRAAEHYVARHPRLVDRPQRFDVIFLAPLRWPRHQVNAFDATFT
jgi:putative endonuclease